MKGIFIQESFRRCILNLKIRKHVEIDTSHRNIFTILANHLCHCYLLKYPKDNFLFGITKCCDLLKIIVFASPSHAFAIYSMFSLYCNCGCEKTLKVAEKKRESKPIWIRSKIWTSLNHFHTFSPFRVSPCLNILYCEIICIKTINVLCS